MGQVGDGLKVEGLLTSEMAVFVGSGGGEFKMSFHFREGVFKNYFN